jgi:hypothetical protein
MNAGKNIQIDTKAAYTSENTLSGMPHLPRCHGPKGISSPASRRHTSSAIGTI